MSAEKAATKRRIGAMELLGIGGFSFFFGWMLTSFFWLFTFFPAHYSIGQRCIIQAFILVGMLAGYLILHFFASKIKMGIYSLLGLIIMFVLMLLVPIAALVSSFDIQIPFALLCLCTFGGGLGASHYLISWLDSSGRMRIGSLFTFTSASFFGGGLLGLLMLLMPQSAQPIVAMVYAAVTAGLLSFIGRRIDPNEKIVILPRKEFLGFTKEVEPSLFVYGIVFGIGFVFVLSHGAEAATFGIVALLLGAAFIFIIDLIGKPIGIIVLQRTLLCVTVASCLILPFTQGFTQVIASCFVLAAWSAFTSSNYALLTKRSITAGLTVLYHIPSAIGIGVAGFLTGWIIATALIIFNADSSIVTAALLGLAFILVFVVMLFFPSEIHHDEAAAAKEREKMLLSIAGTSEEIPFEKRCEAVAKMFQLSPRESDILLFLAKGRNTSYIQNKLCISPHTVKSHIYSIYRKVDIHSQQKLMDFVETYPVDPSILLSAEDDKKQKA